VCDQFDSGELIPAAKSGHHRDTVQARFSPIFTTSLAANAKPRPEKAQDRDDDERIASSSALKIGMKNAALRRQAAL
jgi:hypothetical protein